MANKIVKLRLCIAIDPTTGDPTAVETCRYRVEDDAALGVRTGTGLLSVAVGDLNKTGHNTGAVGELIRDLVDAAKTAEGL